MMHFGNGDIPNGELFTWWIIVCCNCFIKL